MDLSNPANLSQLLAVLQQNETAQIRQAEKLLKPFAKNAASVGPLIQQIQGNPDQAIRLQASLLLKKGVARHYKKMPPDQQAALRSTLLGMLTTETVGIVRTAIAGVVSALATTVFEIHDNWPEVFGVLTQLAQDPDDSRRSLTYNLLGQVLQMQYFISTDKEK